MAGGRPSKKGLDWFKKDVNYYEDIKVFMLMDKYGPLGSTIFDCILCMIYRDNGYYLVSTPDTVAMLVMRTIGTKWFKQKDFVQQVVHYCAEIDLFDKDLLAQNVLTSAGIQRRYAEATKRSKANKSLYWLIDENGQPLKNISSDRISVAETEVFVAETEVFVEKAPIREDKRRTDKRRENSAAANAAAPSLDEVKAYCEAKGLRVDPERFWNRFNAVGWVLHGDPVHNWKSVLHNWEKNERPRAAESEPAHQPSYDLDEYEKYDIFSAKEKQK